MEPMANSADEPGGELQERILSVLLEFPHRIDSMETRNEENCRILAYRLVDLFEHELERRRAASG